LLAVLCAIAASMAIGDQFAIFGIDRGVGGVGTFRAPTGQPIVAGAPDTITTGDPVPAPSLPAAGSLPSPSLTQPPTAVPQARAGRAPAAVTRHRRLDD
jgi:hypothetical protein